MLASFADDLMWSQEAAYKKHHILFTPAHPLGCSPTDNQLGSYLPFLKPLPKCHFFTEATTCSAQDLKSQTPPTLPFCPNFFHQLQILFCFLAHKVPTYPIFSLPVCISRPSSVQAGVVCLLLTSRLFSSFQTYQLHQSIPDASIVFSAIKTQV